MFNFLALLVQENTKNYIFSLPMRPKTCINNYRDYIFLDLASEFQGIEFSHYSKKRR